MNYRTKITKSLTETLDSMGNVYTYEETELFGRKYLKVVYTGRDYWPEGEFCRRWVYRFQDKRPIDICNIGHSYTNGECEASFLVTEIYKSDYDKMPYEWKRHNRNLIGY